MLPDSGTLPKAGQSVFESKLKSFKTFTALSVCLYYSYLVLNYKKKSLNLFIWFEISIICTALGTVPELEIYVMLCNLDQFNRLQFHLIIKYHFYKK